MICYHEIFYSKSERNSCFTVIVVYSISLSLFLTLKVPCLEYKLWRSMVLIPFRRTLLLHAFSVSELWFAKLVHLYEIIQGLRRKKNSIAPSLCACIILRQIHKIQWYRVTLLYLLQNDSLMHLNSLSNLIYCLRVRQHSELSEETHFKTFVLLFICRRIFTFNNVSRRK